MCTQHMPTSSTPHCRCWRPRSTAVTMSLLLPHVLRLQLTVLLRQASGSRHGIRGARTPHPAAVGTARFDRCPLGRWSHAADEGLRRVPVVAAKASLVDEKESYGSYTHAYMGESKHETAGGIAKSINVLLQKHQRTLVEASTYSCRSINVLLQKHQRTLAKASTYPRKSINVPSHAACKDLAPWIPTLPTDRHVLPLIGRISTAWPGAIGTR